MIDVGALHQGTMIYAALTGRLPPIIKLRSFAIHGGKIQQKVFFLFFTNYLDKKVVAVVIKLNLL